MKYLKTSFAVIALMIISCNQDFGTITSEDESAGTPLEVRAELINMGFNPEGFYNLKAGYMVEGDIFLSFADLKFLPNTKVPVVEQYRTTNLVRVNGIKTITISLENSLASISGSLDEAIARYNAEFLSINFQRVNSSANICITQVTNVSYAASAGFPSGGKPYKSILVNTTAISGQPLETVATILAHEMGHCIGFRHTDYFDRFISCGGLHFEEIVGREGAILIPGTPDTASLDAQSWMLACIGSGQNRLFNVDDKIALHYLY